MIGKALTWRRWKDLVTKSTERGKVEYKLQKSRARYRAVVDTAFDAIITITPDAIVRSFNRGAERIFGYRAEEVIGQPVTLLMPERYRDLCAAGLQRYLETGEARVIGGTTELVGLRNDGSEFPIELSIGEIHEGEEKLFTGIIRDISERKQAEEEIRRLNATLEKKVAERTAQLADRERRLEDLVGELITAQEEERRRVAYEVHDSLIQMAIATQRYIQAFADTHPPGSKVRVGELDRPLKLIQETVQEARRVVKDLRPTTLDDFGLATALRQRVEELQDEGWEISYEETLEEERLPNEIEITLYRVTQEALNNVQKHARTTEARVELTRRGRKVRLEVRDRGRGFDPSAVSRKGGPVERVGLSSMQERVALLGGELEIRSEPGAGASVIAEVPLPATFEGRGADHEG